jgi:hypothetical protein
VKNARKTGHIVIAGQDTIYDVSAVGSDTSITLTSPYVGTTKPPRPMSISRTNTI